MTAKPISPALSVSEQILPQDIAALAAAGFRSVICNRPDGEGPDQPAFAQIEAAAKAAGLQAVYLPIIPGKIGDADVLAFGTLMDELPKPVLAYCRTGTRSTSLWSLLQAGRGQPVGEILTAATGAGYDMSGLVPRMINGGTVAMQGGEAAPAVQTTAVA